MLISNDPVEFYRSKQNARLTGIIFLHSATETLEPAVVDALEVIVGGKEEMQKVMFVSSGWEDLVSVDFCLATCTCSCFGLAWSFTLFSIPPEGIILDWIGCMSSCLRLRLEDTLVELRVQRTHYHSCCGSSCSNDII